MLKITAHKETQPPTLELEGRLAGPWVEELDRCWRTVADPQQSRLVVDLTGVTFIDSEGKALLARMWRGGATLHAGGCLTRCIVEDIVKGDRSASSHLHRKEKTS